MTVRQTNRISHLGYYNMKNTWCWGACQLNSLFSTYKRAQNRFVIYLADFFIIIIKIVHWYRHFLKCNLLTSITKHYNSIKLTKIIYMLFFINRWLIWWDFLAIIFSYLLKYFWRQILKRNIIGNCYNSSQSYGYCVCICVRQLTKL